jgi:hypothetical protein
MFSEIQSTMAALTSIGYELTADVLVPRQLLYSSAEFRALQTL